MEGWHRRGDAKQCHRCRRTYAFPTGRGTEDPVRCEDPPANSDPARDHLSLALPCPPPVRSGWEDQPGEAPCGWGPGGRTRGAARTGAR